MRQRTQPCLKRVTKRVWTSVVAVTTLAAVQVQAQVISGPNGGIESVGTGATLLTGNGGSSIPDALIDGATNGSNDTWVEYTFDDSFTFRFDQAYNVAEFRLWNDRGVPDSGIGDFTLRFQDVSNTLIGTFSGTTAAAPSGNGPAQSFTIPTMVGTTQVTLIVDNPHRGRSVQFREVEFETDTGVVVDGPSGRIDTVGTGATLLTGNGGSSIPDALIDGATNGGNDTWVEYFFNDSFTFRFDQAYDVDEFRLWNDRGVPDSGIGDFTLRFQDVSNTLIGTFSGTTAAAPSGNGPAQSFAIPTMVGTTQVTLIVDNPHRGRSVQFREVEFETDTAVVVDGPSGRIDSVSTGATLLTGNGGSSLPDALIDGATNGSNDTWVEYTFNDSFIFRFDQAYDVDEFRLWNDRGVPDSGIGDFTLRFKNAANTLIGSFSGTTAAAPSGNGPAQSFAIPTMVGATQVTLIVDNPHRGTSVQFREVEFGFGFVATAFCFGVGGACPCGNDSPPSAEAGCINSTGAGGALEGSGDPFSEYAPCPSVTPPGTDTLTLMATGVPNGPALLFKGTTNLNNGLGIQFGDGLRCCGGQITRSGIQFGVGNQLSFGFPSSKLSVDSQSCGGMTYCYQVWYRDTGAICGGAQFNLTNAVEITWLP